MKTKQKNIRVFELDSDDAIEALAYLEKNSDLLRAFVLAIKGKASAEMYEWAQNNKHCAFIAPECLYMPKQAFEKIPTMLFDGGHKEILLQNSDENIKNNMNEVVAPIKNIPNRIVITRVLRSGEIIENDGDIVIFGRVNSGAKIISKGAVEIFDEVDGLVECDGDYIILRSIGKGSVVYKNETIKKELLKYDLQKLCFENGHLQVKKI